MKKLYTAIVLLFFAICFHAWLLPGNISGYDHPYFFPEHVKELKYFPLVWDSVSGNGLGENILPLFWVGTYLQIITTVFAIFLNIPWELVQRIGWFFPYIILSCFSPYYFLKSLKIKLNTFGYIIGALIYTLNTYILMIIAGGQMNIALAYAISPLVLAQFIKPLEKYQYPKRILLKNALISGLLNAALIMLDLRIALLIIAVGGIYCLMTIIFHYLGKTKKANKQFILKYNSIWVFGIPLLTALLIHTYWIVPIALTRQTHVAENSAVYTNDAVSFFSFAKFEDAFGLLHPNWPENIFGKVGFMKPEFLVLPIMAYLCLVFLKRSEKEKNYLVLFFTFLGLLGSFLAKGTNDPFGTLYAWSYLHIPAFSLFRDPTKFYIYIALAYLTLIPISLQFLTDWLKQKIKAKKLISDLVFIAVIVYLAFLIRPALFGMLNGTLQTTSIPSDYFKLETLLNQDNTFSRTLWFPLRQRYGFYDNNHPAVNAQDLFQMYNQQDLLKKIKDKRMESYLQEASIKYIIVPIDAEKEIFLTDNKYSSQKYNTTVTTLKKITWLKPIKQFQNLQVFEIPNPKPLLWSTKQNSIIGLNYQSANTTQYSLDKQSFEKGQKIIFTQSYNSGWTAKIEKENIQMKAIPYQKNYNSFIIPSTGKYKVDIFYKPQQLVNSTEIISVVFLLTVIVAIIFLEFSMSKTTEY